jgi:hypothetical protein
MHQSREIVVINTERKKTNLITFKPELTITSEFGVQI